VKFTQFLRPDGRRREITIARDDTIEAKAAELCAYGWNFEIEELTDGTIHMDCCSAEQQLANELCDNGPPVTAAVERLVHSAHATWLVRGRPHAKG